MSTPAGWYDDGSGRRRWWDGAQAERIRQYEAAYALAHGGQAPPAGQLPPAAFASQTASAARTNVLAVVSFVLALVGGGVVGFVLGLIALSQIRRTGERGRGLAIAAIVIAVVSVLLTLVTLLVVVPMMGSR